MIFLMSAALIGLIFLQLYWISESYKLKSGLFDHAVNDALAEVSRKMEKAEAASFIKTKAEMPAISRKRFPSAPKRPDRYPKPVKKEHIEEIKIIVPPEPPDAPFISEKKFKFRKQLHDSIMLEVDSLLRNIKFTWADSTSALIRKFHNADSAEHTSMIFYHGMNLLPAPPEIKKNTDEKAAVVVKDYLKKISREGKETEVFKNLADEMRQLHIPIRQRIKPQMVDSLLKIELTNRGISLPYTYKIYQAKTDSLVFSNASFNAERLPDHYRTALFPGDFFRETAYLSLTFPGKDHYLLRKMIFVMASSAGLILVIISGFAYTIFSMLKQKKISRMKTDFINNMTHEFKTPVSTIMLASEALREEGIASDPGRIRKLAGVIYEENLRLSHHVERVLNLATLEKETFRMELQPVDVHEEIRKAIEAMSMQFEQRNARVEFLPEAESSCIQADPLHFSNIVLNLLDNAVKYCEREPFIRVKTLLQDKKFYLVVEDNGIGMSSDQQKKIFEQFYRVPTGNLHNVKGFGLGLNYVYNIVRRMNGSINVSSEKYKGSRFELSFPITL